MTRFEDTDEYDIGVSLIRGLRAYRPPAFARRNNFPVIKVAFMNTLDAEDLALDRDDEGTVSFDTDYDGRPYRVSIRRVDG